MASEIRQILDAETLVDLDKLRQLTRYGIPDEIRADTWQYLLGVETADKANEISTRHAKYEKYQQTDRQSTDMVKRIRGETTRYYRARSKLHCHFQDPNPVMENVITAYLSQYRGAEYSPALVYLTGPFLFVMHSESDVYYCFAALMQMVEEHCSEVTMASRLAEFLMLFRTLLPELHNHFEEEEVDFKEIANSWFSYILAKELPLDCLLRLWDVYFSLEHGLQAHVYVCLAILTTLKDNLEELEQSEIHGVLLRLPSMDMDHVIKLALTIKDEVLAKRLSDN
ncbi:hypothetical protein HDU98_012160 [Podochytrium sp. JEL0797]|nr:hypothetical protein HDU98_012160 [Podochytrium sp. JEL0797]